jgi:anti-sigma regulatory factor (Ser/Thr protein kinase)
MVTAVHEAVVNSVRYGGGRGVLRLRSDPDYVICEVSDDGTPTSVAAPPFPGDLPPDPRAASGHGMWVVRQLSDLVTETFRPTGVRGGACANSSGCECSSGGGRAVGRGTGQVQ